MRMGWIWRGSDSGFINTELKEKMKSDNSIRKICIASVKRHTIKPIDFELTKIFETQVFSEIYNNTFTLSDVCEDELPISQTTIDQNNWTLITTRQIISCVAGITKITKAESVLKWEWNDFKGYSKTAFTIGQLQTFNDSNMDIFIETGRASMVTIYAIRTLIGQVAG
jgi:hypothetical protein